MDPRPGYWIQRAGAESGGGAFKYKVDRYPTADEAEKSFNAAYIVEFYSKYV